MNERVMFVVLFFSILFISFVGFFFYNLIKGNRQWKEKLKQEPNDRQTYSKTNFISHFVKRGFSTNSANLVYDKTQIFLRANDLVLLPTDDLILLYERQYDEWIYISDKWIGKLGKTKPDKKIHMELLNKHGKINFEYLIELFDKNL